MQEKNPDRYRDIELCDKKSWVPDDRVTNCEGCGTRFSTFSRKHHCRKCGHIFCNSCLKKCNVQLKGDKGESKHQFCKECQISTGLRPSVDESTTAAPAKASKSAGGWFGGGAKKSPSKAKFDLTTLRAWPLRAVKNNPSLETTLTQGFGQMTIKVIAAKNLIAADVNFTKRNTSDPYVTIEVGEHLKSSAKTPVISSTCNPRWNSIHVFPIRSHVASVKMLVYDEDLASGDDVLGMVFGSSSGACGLMTDWKVEFPVSAVCDGIKHECWVYLSIAPGQTDDERKSTAVEGHVGIAGSGCTDGGLGAIQLELSMDWNPEGEYLSHFVREVAPAQPQPEMDIDQLYSNIFALKDMVDPIITTCVWTPLALLKWEDTTRSRVALTTWYTPLVCCYWPWATPLVIHLLLLRHIRLKHTEMKGGCKDSDELPTPKSKQDAQDEHAATLGWLGTVANSSKVQQSTVERVLREMVLQLMMPSETKDWLGGIQNTLLWAANLMDGLYGLFDWRDQSTTKTIAIAICVSLGLHASLLSFGYTLAVVGLFLFSFFTAFYLDAMNLINGHASYYAASFSKSKTDALKCKTE